LDVCTLWFGDGNLSIAADVGESLSIGYDGSGHVAINGQTALTDEGQTIAVANVNSIEVDLNGSYLNLNYVNAQFNALESLTTYMNGSNTVTGSPDGQVGSVSRPASLSLEPPAVTP
jgi:hypothetical protein